MQSVSSHTLPLKSIPSWAELNKATDKKSTDDSQQGVKTINADAESKQWSTQDRKDHDEALKQQNLAALDSLKQSQAKDTASKFLFNADLNAKVIRSHDKRHSLKPSVFCPVCPLPAFHMAW